MKKNLGKEELKGKRGVRLYYSSNFFDDDNDLDLENDKDGNVKCVFTKDLRREKLYAYLKYLNGQKIGIRELAWKFAVTERTIQNDLKFFIDNKFLVRELNANKKGKQLQNSYFVDKAKEKELHLQDTYVELVFVAKKNNDWYIFFKTDYDEIEKEMKRLSIDDYNFELPIIKEKYPNRIDFHSLQKAKELFKKDMSSFYKGIVYSHINKYRPEKEPFLEEDEEYYKDKSIFVLFELDKMYECKTEKTMWVKLSLAPRRNKKFNENKGIRYITKNILG